MKRSIAIVLTIVLAVASAFFSVYLQRKGSYGGVEALLCWLPACCMLGYTVRLSPKRKHKEFLFAMKKKIEDSSHEWYNPSIEKSEKIKMMYRCIKACSTELKIFMTNNPNVLNDDSYIVQFIKHFESFVENDNIPEAYYDNYIQTFNAFYDYLCKSC